MDTLDQPSSKKNQPTAEQQQSVPLNPSLHLKTFLLIVVVIVLMAVSAMGGYYLGANKQSQPSQLSTQPSQSLPTPTPTPTPISDETANWKTYTDKANKFSFKIPAGWSVGISSYTLYGPAIRDNGGNYYAEFYKVSEKDRGITYCDANPQDTETCETLKTFNATVVINWGKFISPISKEAAVAEAIQSDKIIHFDIGVSADDLKTTMRKILSTFQFTN